MNLYKVVYDSDWTLGPTMIYVEAESKETVWNGLVEYGLVDMDENDNFECISIEEAAA